MNASSFVTTGDRAKRMNAPFDTTSGATLTVKSDRGVGPGTHRSPHHVRKFNTRNEGLNTEHCGTMTWLALFTQPYDGVRRLRSVEADRGHVRRQRGRHGRAHHQGQGNIARLVIERRLTQYTRVYNAVDGSDI